jgi:hypothetical protein
MAPTFTSTERDNMRCEFGIFSDPPNGRRGLQLKTWRGGIKAGVTGQHGWPVPMSHSKVLSKIVWLSYGIVPVPFIVFPSLNPPQVRSNHQTEGACSVKIATEPGHVLLRRGSQRIDSGHDAANAEL